MNNIWTGFKELVQWLLLGVAIVAVFAMLCSAIAVAFKFWIATIIIAATLTILYFWGDATNRRYKQEQEAYIKKRQEEFCREEAERYSHWSAYPDPNRGCGEYYCKHCTHRRKEYFRYCR